MSQSGDDFRVSIFALFALIGFFAVGRAGGGYGYNAVVVNVLGMFGVFTRAEKTFDDGFKVAGGKYRRGYNEC